MLDKARSILKNTFGYQSFRLLQEQVIDHTLRKKDALVVMPTGGGKSICYQIPALIFPGLTIVVSPLISLMKDQVDQLTEYGIPALFINSSLSESEYESAVVKIKKGFVKLVYMAPETLLQDRITHQILSEVHIDCITIDEAHCISEWGHDFRPEYRQIAQFRKRYPSAVCIALTATATPEVRKDIADTLELSDAQLFIDSFDRENLFINIVHKSNPLKQTLDFLKSKKDVAGIVYCFSRKQVDELCENLNQKGFNALPYHAGLSDSERSSNQTAFIKDDCSIIVATVAFGMGINKPDIRYVIHYDLPQNIESYYQQIGRAGRDGLPSECLLLYNFADTHKIKYFIEQKVGEQKAIAEKHLAQLLTFIETTDCRRKPLLNYFGEQFKKETCESCDICIRPEQDVQDLTIAAQKFISCMIRTGERFGANYIIDVLRGANIQKIRDNQHDHVSTFGIGKEFSKDQWSQLSRELLRAKLIQKEDEYGSLLVLAKAKLVLKNEITFKGFITEDLKEKQDSYTTDLKSAKKKSSTVVQHEDLFQKLKKYRKELADKRGIPPFAVFHDSTLIDMSNKLPTHKTAFKLVFGVGEQKARSYGDGFMAMIKEFVAKHSINPAFPEKVETPEKPKKTKSSSSKSKDIAQSFNAGSGLAELASSLKVKETTILNHLVKAKEERMIINSKLIKRESKLEMEKQLAVQDAIRKEEAYLLKPIFDKFKGEISYDELRLMSLLV